MARKIFYMLMILFIPNIAQAGLSSSPVVGYALAFDYSQYATIPSSDSLNPGRITLECWVKFRTLNGHAQFFISKGGHTQGAYNIYLMDESIFVFELDAFTDHRVDCPPVTLSAEKWYHVAGVYDGNKIRVTLNGETIGEKEIGYVRIGTTDPLFFNRHLDYSWPFSGDLDEVRLWSVARTDAEITSTMNMELNSAPGLVGAWHLNEGEGQIFKDSAGGHDGYLGASQGVDENDPKWVLNESNPSQSVLLISPAAGEKLIAGKPYAVRWTSGNTAYIRIEYSSDGGAHWITVADNVAGDGGSFLWNVPSELTVNGFLRIADSGDASRFDTNDGPFEIIKPFLQIVSPNGGEVWETGVVHQITWESGGIDSVKIECSPDNGENWNLIVSGISAFHGSYDWNLSGTQSSSFLIKISDEGSLGLSDTSDAVFTINQGFIHIIYPENGEVLIAGSSQHINWESSKNIAVVNIELSTDEGASWTLVASTSAKTGIYYWTVSDAPSSRCLIKIENSKDPLMFDISDQVFSIVLEPASSGDNVWSNFKGPVITSLDVEGDDLWLVFDYNKVRKWSPEKGLIESHDLDFFVRKIAVSNEGVLLGSDEGLYRLSNGTVKSLAYDNLFATNSIRQLAVTPGGTVWICAGSVVAKLDGSTWKTYTTDDGLPSNDVRTIATNQTEDVWFYNAVNEGSDITNYLTRFDGVNWDRYFMGHQFVGGIFGALYNGSKNFVLFTMSAISKDNFGPYVESGINYHDGTGHPLYGIQKYGTQSLGDVALSPLIYDTNGFLWYSRTGIIGSFKDGVNKDYILDDLYGGKGSNPTVVSAVQGANGTLWFLFNSSTGANSVWSYSGGQFHKHSFGLWNKTVLSMGISPDNISWFGTPTGVSRYDGTSWSVFTAQDSPLVNNTVNAITVDKQGAVWFGTAGGISRFDGKEWTTFEPGLSIYSSAIDRNDVLWFGASDGVRKFDGTVWTSFGASDGWNAGAVKSVAVDQRNVLWFGTDGHGILSYDGKNWTTYTTLTSGLLSDTVTSIVADRNNTLWMATPLGIGVFNGAAWRSYTPGNSGLQKVPVLSIAVDRDDVKWIGSVDGVTRFQDDSWKKYTDSASPNGKAVNTIFIDGQNGKWFGTSYGVYNFNNNPTSVQDELQIPRAITLLSNYPNPFNPSTTISYTLPEAGRASLVVYDITGRKVCQLLSGYLPAGAGTAVWDGKDDSGKPVSSGVYMARLSAGKLVAVGKMLLVK